MFCDLHIHTQCSDGTLTPAAAAVRCREKGVALAAVADHNTWMGCAAFSSACQAMGISAVRACEFSCNRGPLHLHLLGYGFRPTPELEALAARSRALMLQMSVDLIAKLSKTDPRVSPEDYARYVYDRSRGGWAGLRYLIDRGVSGSPAEVFPLYAACGCDYADYPFPTLAETCAAVTRAGGAPVLAHPGNWFSALGEPALRATLSALAREGVRGVECYYPVNGSRMTEICRDFCQKRGLLITAGGDCHGDFAKTDRFGSEYDIGVTKTPVSDVFLSGWMPKM